jgi:hypothetical protein
MSRRTASWIAWAVCALSLALTALSFLLIALNLSLDAPIYFYWVEPTVIAVGYSVIGAIIASRLPNHPIGWICCAIGVLGAVEHFSGEYAIYALLAPHPEALLGGKVMLWMSLWAWILMFGFIVFLLLLFPTGRLPSNRWRPFAWMSAALTLMQRFWPLSYPMLFSIPLAPLITDASPSPIHSGLKHCQISTGRFRRPSSLWG